MKEFFQRSTKSIKVQALVLLSLLAVALLLQLKWQGYGPRYVLPDVLSIFLLSLVFISLIDVIQRYYNSKKPFNESNSALLVVSIGIVSGMNYFFSGVFSGWNPSYMHEVEVSFPVRIMGISLLFLFVHLRFWSREKQANEEKSKALAVEQQRDMVQIEINSIQQQLKPHFLFNSLNSINALTMTNPEEAQKMVQLLSEFMRGSIQQNQSETVTLKEEIRHLKLYTDIEKVRFGDRLSIEYHLDEQILEKKLPFLILQPIIENAIKYGLYGNTDDVTIHISARMHEEYLLIEVSNPFDAITQETNKGTGYGIRSVQRKLLLLYQRGNLLKTQTKNSIFTATLQIPQV
ncbi:MAG: histidine kinase [bacterium]|nr:histidine kinase [bacterium]